MTNVNEEIDIPLAKTIIDDPIALEECLSAVS